MADGFVVNDYELLDSIKIKHSHGEVDVTQAVAITAIQESLNFEEIRCELVIMDASGSLDIVEFDGTETFKISFASTGEDDPERTHHFRIYRIDKTIDKEKNDVKIYSLKAMSAETIKQSSMDINQSFKCPIHKAVQNIFDKLGSDKKLHLHETTGQYTYIIPGMTPFESFTFLCRRAYDSKFRASVFCFYENIDGYNFKNIERVISEEREKPLEYKYTPTSLVKDTNPQYAITDIELPSNKDIMQKIMSGAYANAVREIDLIKQRINSNEVKVKEDFITFEHLDDVAMSLDSKALIDEHLNTINSTKWINNAGVDDKRMELIPRRRFYQDCLSQVNLQLTVPGNSNLSIGKVLDLNMLELSGKTEEKGQEPRITGKYLITNVNHNMTGGQYTCDVDCVKESYKANSDNLENNIVVKQ